MNTAEQPNRFNALQDWLSVCLAEQLGGQPLQMEALSGDAGFRAYYRITGLSMPLLAVDAPPQTENSQAFCHVARLLRQHGIHAPQVYAVDFARGYLLIENMGDVLYAQVLQNTDLRTVLYHDAETCLLKMMAIPTGDLGVPYYDQQKLQQEFDLFADWFVRQLLQVTPDVQTEQQIKSLGEQLIQSALQQPAVLVHRDFHCRNLLRVPNNNPGVIDFQDAVLGPCTYDLVSLYRDCYVHWPEQDVCEWVRAYHQRARDAGFLHAVSFEQYLYWFDWMGLQRHIKVLGIFARLHLRDGKSGYLKDLPLVMHYVVSIARKYPEFLGFVKWFEQTIIPCAQQQSWYRQVS